MPNTPHSMGDSRETQGSSKSKLPQTSRRPPTNGVAGEPIVSSDQEMVFIAVMGPTGTGKSTFVNLVSRSNLDIGGGLRSCTNAVQLGKPFDLDGRRVVLIDTPGFDDTVRSDIDVLNMVATFLATSYQQNIKLTSVLYFHRISDVKMGGAQVKNFKMFRKLCGERALQNVVIVTNMWEGVDRRVGEKREAELKGKDIFFKPVLEKRAQMARHENNIRSAEDILRLGLNNRPLPLRIQVELVDEHKSISETSAGEELNQELDAQIRKHKEDLRILEEEIQRAVEDGDEETKKELEGEAKKMRDWIEGIEWEAKRLGPDYWKKEQKIKAVLRSNRSSRLAFEPSVPSILVATGAAILTTTIAPDLSGVAKYALITTIAIASSIRIRSG